MKRQIISLALIAILFTSALLTSACGNTTTLARVGAGFQQAAAGFAGEVASLKAAGLLSPDKAARLEQKAAGFTTAAKALADYLNGLPGVNAGNKAEIAGEIAKASGLISGLLQNPDITSLRPDALIVKVLNFANITLQQVAIVLAAVNAPPGNASFSAIGGSDGVPLSAIKVKTPAIPKGAEKYFSK